MTKTHTSGSATCFRIAMLFFACSVISVKVSGNEDISRRFTLETGGFWVIPHHHDRKNQAYGSMTVGYEFLELKRHSLSVRCRMIHYSTRTTDFRGYAGGVADYIWQNPDSREGWFLQWQLGGIWMDHSLHGSGSDWNFYSEVNFGYFFPEIGIYFLLGGQHISNGYLASPNIGINGLGVSTGIRF